MEEELHREQVEMHKLLKAKQELIDIQKKRIEFLSHRLTASNPCNLDDITSSSSSSSSPATNKSDTNLMQSQAFKHGYQKFNNLIVSQSQNRSIPTMMTSVNKTTQIKQQQQLKNVISNSLDTNTLIAQMNNSINSNYIRTSEL